MKELSMQTARTAIVCYEDRTEWLISVKLLALSLAEHSPNLPILLYAPEAVIPDAFREWVTRNAPLVEIRPAPSECMTGWSAKPFVLIDALEKGCDQAIWIDADIMVTKPIEPRFFDLPPNVLSTAPEARGFNPDRAAVWGFNVIRPLAVGINSSVLRCTSHHLSILRKWAQLMQTSKYTDAQKMNYSDRPSILFGDQDVLEGLLISDAMQPADPPPLDQLENGGEIIHGTALPAPKICSLSRVLPMFVHAIGLKPWHLQYIDKHSRRRIKYVQLELSLYALLARKYKTQLEEAKVETWINPKTPFGQACDILTFSHPYLRQAPLMTYTRLGARFGW